MYTVLIGSLAVIARQMGELMHMTATREITLAAAS